MKIIISNLIYSLNIWYKLYLTLLNYLNVNNIFEVINFNSLITFIFEKYLKYIVLNLSYLIKLDIIISNI